MYSVNKSIEQHISIESFNKRNVKLFMKRDDLIDLEVSGNKWRKLKYNVEYVQQHKLKGILTFGGAFSNHLLATASACYKFNLKAIGIVRGEELKADSNPVLKRCVELGMELIFVSRELYGLRNDYDYKKELKTMYPLMHVVPEGGANYLGMIGCQEILGGINLGFDHIFVAMGTGTTAAGVACSLRGNQKLHVVSALKGMDVRNELANLYLSFGFSKQEINEWLESVLPHEDAHFGGYGKTTIELLEKIGAFEQSHGIAIDPIYTGKVWAALENWIESENITNSKVLMIHTGGVYGGQHIMSEYKKLKK
jgi:1-aminocyclopropane-1-carboxylate deaminase